MIRIRHGNNKIINFIVSFFHPVATGHLAESRLRLCPFHALCICQHELFQKMKCNDDAVSRYVYALSLRLLLFRGAIIFANFSDAHPFSSGRMVHGSFACIDFSFNLMNEFELYFRNLIFVSVSLGCKIK